jgi:hypothetical protein
VARQAADDEAVEVLSSLRAQLEGPLGERCTSCSP